MLQKGVLFNSSCSAKWDIGQYEWLQQFQCFTFEELKAVWEYIPQVDKDKLMSSFRCNVHDVILEFLDSDLNQTVENSLYYVLTTPNTRTKQISIFLRDRQFSLPTLKIQKWE